MNDCGCTCQKCGSKYKVDFIVEDELWNLIRDNKNMLCGLCICKAIEQINEFMAFKVNKT